MLPGGPARSAERTLEALVHAPATTGGFFSGTEPEDSGGKSVACSGGGGWCERGW